ncbi:MAG: EcsC family protein [Thiohalocapsa sp.]
MIYFPVGSFAVGAAVGAAVTWIVKNRSHSRLPVDAVPPPIFEVIHSSPGQIRFRLQALRHDVGFATRLRALMSASASVVATTVHPAAASINVAYTAADLTEAQIKERFSTAINQAADPGFEISLDAHLSGYELHGLTAYEYLRVRDIMAWQATDPSAYRTLSGKVMAPIKRAADAMVPDRLLKKAMPIMQSAMSNWHREWDALKKHAGVDHLEQLKEPPLETSDRLAEWVKDRALEHGSVQGGLSMAIGYAGDLVYADLYIRVAIETIHRTGLCYGYAPRTELEQRFAWAVLAIATASDAGERQAALARLQDVHQALYQQVVGTLIEETVVGDLSEIIAEPILTGMLSRILETEAAGGVPGIGIAFGVADGVGLIKDVSSAARHEFQLRWLLENQAKAG